MRTAIARSAELTRGSRWYILGALILIFVLQLVFNFLITVVAAAIGGAMGAASLAGSSVTGPGGSLDLTTGFGSLLGHLTAFSSLINLLLAALYYPVIAITMAILRSDFMWRADTAAGLQAAPPGS